MKKDIWLRVLLCILIIPFLLFTGFIGIFITAFSGGGKFYTPLVMIVTAFLILFVILRAFRLLKPKILYIYLLSFFVLAALSVTGYEINKAYRSSIPSISEQGVNLYDYRPFTENTQAVSLDESSTLKLEDNLPRLDGATALYPLYSAFARAVYPQKDYGIYGSEVMCNTTPEAYNNLINGSVDIIFAAKPSKEQIEEAKKRGIEFKLTPIGYEAFVFFVNSKNPVSRLSVGQIQDIYSGKIVNWSSVGGRDERIKAFQRPNNSGSQTMLQKLMEGKNLMTPPKEDVAASMGGIIEQTANYRNYKNAIGYSFLYFATEMVKNSQIKLLEVDGVFPDKSTIRSKQYPLTAEFYAVTTNSSNPNAGAFIQWILSSQGQSLVEKTGYTSINN